MKRLLLLLLLLTATTVYAATTSTNGYFYLPDVGDTGTSVHSAWVAVQEATDAVIKLNVDHRNDNTQAHSDYLINNGSDTMSGTLTATGFVGIGTQLTAINGENISDDTIDDDSLDFTDITCADITMTDCGAMVASSFDGEYITNDTIDDDSIDFGDVTCTDLTMTDCGAITSTGVIDFSGATSVEVPNGASVTTDAFGEIGADNDAWDTGRGAIQVYDGTGAAYLVGIDDGDTCTNGQVPQYNSGVWTCEDDAGGTITGTDTYVLFFDGANSPAGDSGMTYNKTTDTISVGILNTDPAASPTAAQYDSDCGDGDISTQQVTACTDTGSGTEDCDYTMSQQIGGAMTAFLTADADGNVTIRSLASNQETKCAWIENPVAETLESIIVNKTSLDWNLTEMWGESDQTVNFDFQVDDGTPADVNGTDLAPAAGEAEDTSLSGDTTLAAGEELDLVITSVASSPTWVSACVTYTY
jgi:hypothetical protein